MRETSTRYGSLPVDICRKMAEGTWAAQGCRRAWEPESLCHPREDVVFDWFEHCDLDAVMRKAKFKPSSSQVQAAFPLPTTKCPAPSSHMRPAGSFGGLGCIVTETITKQKKELNCPKIFF